MISAEFRRCYIGPGGPEQRRAEESMKKLGVIVGLLAFSCLSCSPLKRFAYEGFSRDSWQQPDRVVEALGLEPGDRVADVGSGSGYFTLRLAEAVGPDGKVYAVDVDEDMNDYLRERVREAGVDNVEVILGKYEDPLLPDGEIDLVLTVNTYHHIQDRPSYFRNLQTDLTSDGRIAIVDFDGRKGWFVRLMVHSVPTAEVVEEMREAGYRLDRDLDFLERQSFLIFSPEKR
jgi:ubiquinone/menaquinone biosynthesis C-methylase UbiE